MEQSKAMEYESRKASSDVLKPSNIYIYIYIYSRLGENMGKYGKARHATDDNTVRRMCIVRWITKATDTHSEYVTFIAFR